MEGIGLPLTFAAADIAIYRISGTDIILISLLKVEEEKGLSCLLFVFQCRSSPPFSPANRKILISLPSIMSLMLMRVKRGKSVKGLLLGRVSPIKTCQKTSMDKKPVS